LERLGGSRRLCLVNEALAKEYFGGSSPVGRILAQGTKRPPNTEIIGVFADAKYHEVRGTVPRQIFIGMDSHIRNIGGVTVYARIQGDPRQVMAQLRDQVRRIDSNLVVTTCARSTIN